MNLNMTNAPIKLLGGAPVSLSLYFCLVPPYINTLITLFSSTPPFFITHIFPLTLALSRGRGIGAEQFDRRISMLIHNPRANRDIL